MGNTFICEMWIVFGWSQKQSMRFVFFGILSHNHIAALTSFTGGGIRVYRADSTEDLTFGTSGTLQFDAHFDHETLPWSGGDIVLVAFSVGCIENLEPEPFNLLHSFGIPLPCDMRHANPSELTTTGEPDLGVCVEIFSGSARLSTAMQAAGFQVLAFDHKASPSFPTQLLDLTSPEHQDAPCEIIVDNASRLQHIHIAPPCGTCSAARERPIPGFAEAGLASPVPLGDAENPMRLPHLPGTDLIRVTQANCLYTFVCRLVRLAKSLGIAVSIENPGNSWMWCLPPFLELFAEVSGETVYFHACMRGGSRDKLTCFWCTDDRFNELSAACSKDHKHESWKPRIVQGRPVFPTASEAAYPVLLCQRMAELIRCAVTALLPQLSLFGPAPSHLRLALEKQPRKRRPLVSLYAADDAWALGLAHRAT